MSFSTGTNQPVTVSTKLNSFLYSSSPLSHFKYPSISKMFTPPTTKSKPKSKFLLLFSMASLLSLSLLSLFLYLSLASAAKHHRRPPPQAAAVDLVRQACNATRHPDSCQASLNDKVSGGATALQVVRAAMEVAAGDLASAKTAIADILAGSAGNANRTGAAKNCLELLRLSDRRLSAASGGFPARVKDARAWASAALTFQYDCWSALKYANDSAEVGRAMAFLNDTVLAHTSNALAMVLSYDLNGADTKLWAPPATERQGNFEAAGGDFGFSGGMEAEMRADATVCGGGACDYARVQEAVDAAPVNKTTGRFVISIKEGVYDEIVTVPLEKQNVVFLGEGMGKTVITGSLYSGMPGITTYNTATVRVQGDGFMARGITFQNTAKPNPDVHQAVAFRSDSDRSVIQECEFIGHQDTLYPHTLRQFYKSCRIQGNVDFIFGNAAAVFQDCLILVSPREVNPEKGESNAVTAHGRIDPSQSAGFVFRNCIINGTEEYMKLYKSNQKVHKSYLGRPWKEFSRVVFIGCQLEALIKPEGWLPWSGDFALQTLYYGEFENSGPGSDRAARVDWSSTIPGDHVATYSVKNFIQGDEWIPSRAR